MGGDDLLLISSCLVYSCVDPLPLSSKTVPLIVPFDLKYLFFHFICVFNSPPLFHTAPTKRRRPHRIRRLGHLSCQHTSEVLGYEGKLCSGVDPPCQRDSGRRDHHQTRLGKLLWEGLRGECLAMVFGRGGKVAYNIQ